MVPHPMIHIFDCRAAEYVYVLVCISCAHTPHSDPPGILGFGVVIGPIAGAMSYEDPPPGNGHQYQGAPVAAAGPDTPGLPTRPPAGPTF